MERRDHRWVSAIALAIGLVACRREPPPDQNPGSVVLRGRVTGKAASIPGAAISPLGPDQAVKIIVTSGDHYEVHDVVAGAFEFPVGTDRPAGLVLVGPMDDYLGFVAVRGSIPGVPVHALDEGVTSLDLGTLVASGAVVAPGVDPIGHGITLDDAEIAALSELGVLARSFLADPDVDGDGVIDLLQGREFRTQVAVFRTSRFVGLVGQPVGPVSGWSLGVNVAEAGVTSYPQTATVTGPAGSGVDGQIVQGRMGGSQNVLYGVPLPIPDVQPAPGLWTMTFGARSLAFEIVDMSNLVALSPSLEPTVVLNPDQTIQRVDWIWRMADGTVSTSGSTLASNVMVQIRAISPAVPCAASNVSTLSDGIVYGMTTAADVTSHPLACQDIPWSAVQSIELSYTDVFGGMHGFGFGGP